LLALYWTGGVPRPYRIRDISSIGAFIETKDEWYVGTMLHLVLEHDGPGHLSRKTALGLWAQVVRAGAGGMGVSFIMRSRNEQKEFQRFLAAAFGEGVREIH
jgi:hypothetical protein